MSDATTSMQPLLTIEEAAEILRVEPTTVKGWVREKKLPAVKLSYRTLRIRPQDLQNYIDQSID